MPVARSLSSAEIEREFPFTVSIIVRTPWFTHETLVMNQSVHDPGVPYRCGEFNSMRTYHIARQEPAETLREFVAARRYDRLFRDCPRGSSREEVAAEWRRIEDERQAILAWARRTRMLQAVVQEYRFGRQGDASCRAHENASKLVAKADPSIADPMNHAGVLIEWAEREHRAWFWRCCRRHHVL
ncbi:hypothetical protein [Reyranella sp.]|uniref:hypothetical protein n=1 Tax=Reyranella sp. TaxID=1929291 RepID=UPI003D117E25